MPTETTTQLSEQDIDAIEARENAATKGPWHAYHRVSPRGAYKQWHIGNKDGLCQITMNGHERDYQFMAHARTDIPALIRDWRALRAENDGLRGKAAELRNRISEHGSRLAARISENAALREQLAETQSRILELETEHDTKAGYL